jgi:hypothetical protein
MKLMSKKQNVRILSLLTTQTGLIDSVPPNVDISRLRSEAEQIGCMPCWVRP